MKVRNPNACLANVHVDGDYVRIGPGQEADVPAESVAGLIKAGMLEQVKGGRGQQAAAAGGPPPADKTPPAGTDPAGKAE